MRFPPQETYWPLRRSQNTLKDRAGVAPGRTAMSSRGVGGRGLKVASLFTGSGALDLGLEQAGHEIILQCECDPEAQASRGRKKGDSSLVLFPSI